MTNDKNLLVQSDELGLEDMTVSLLDGEKLAGLKDVNGNQHLVESSDKRNVEQRWIWRNILGILGFHLLALYFLLVRQAFKPDLHFASIQWQWFLMLFGTFSLTAGSHRLWAHRDYKARWPLRLFYMVGTCLAMQNDIFSFSRDHRTHHKYSETEADPHSAKDGFFNPYVGWMLRSKHPKVIEAGNKLDFSDLLADPIVRFQHRFYIPLCVVFWFLVPVSVPMYFWRESLFNALSVNVLRHLMMLHSAWILRAFGHLRGIYCVPVLSFDSNQICPPDDVISPCYCEKTDYSVFLDFTCVNEVSYSRIFSMFQNISNSTYAKSYYHLMCHFKLDDNFPDYLFADIAIKEIQLGFIYSESFENISKKALLNSKTKRNVETTAFMVKFFHPFSFKELINFVCSQLENLQFFMVQSKYFINLHEGDLDDCLKRPLKGIWIESDNYHGLIVVEKNFIFNTQINHLILTGKIKIIKNYAFCKKDQSDNFVLKLEYCNIDEIEPFAFVGFNSLITTIELKNINCLLEPNKEAIRNYFEENVNNTIRIKKSPQSVDYFQCSCGLRWLFEKKELKKRFVGKNIKCENGVNFWDLDKIYFDHCIRRIAIEKMILFWTGIIVSLFFLCLLGTVVVFRKRIKIFFRKCYQMRSTPRGLCVIINNIKFASVSNLKTRHGSEKDEENLKEVFETFLHFEVEIHRNQTAGEILNLFKELKSDARINNVDAFCVVIMSHGGAKDVIFGIDGEGFKLQEVTECFNDESCPALRGKPKMFFVNACRGEAVDNGRNRGLLQRRLQLLNEMFRTREFSNTETDLFDLNETLPNLSKENVGPKWQDMIIVYSSVSDHVSIRNVNEGSWFVCSLVKRLKELAPKTHLENILKAVTENMKEMTTLDSTTGRPIYVVPVIEKRAFTKYLYFNP